MKPGAAATSGSVSAAVGYAGAGELEALRTSEPAVGAHAARGTAQGGGK